MFNEERNISRYFTRNMTSRFTSCKIFVLSFYRTWIRIISLSTWDCSRLSKKLFAEGKLVCKENFSSVKNIRHLTKISCIYIYVTLSSLRTWKLSTKFYASYKSSINYQKNSITKSKTKTNVYFDITLTVNE